MRNKTRWPCTTKISPSVNGKLAALASQASSSIWRNRWLILAGAGIRGSFSRQREQRPSCRTSYNSEGEDFVLTRVPGDRDVATVRGDSQAGCCINPGNQPIRVRSGSIILPDDEV